MLIDPRIRGTQSKPDLLLVNSPLRDYGVRPRLNDFTLPTLGLGYIATCAENAGFSVGLLDVEALALSIDEAAQLINSAAPRWVGLNLLAPTYRYSKAILRQLDPTLLVMLGGHQAKAMPARILDDVDIPRIDALVLGEAETRVVRLLEDIRSRASLPKLYWRAAERGASPETGVDQSLLAPNIDALPFLNRKFLPQDPYPDNGAIESAMVASRGCPFDCSFCGAAVSANPDVDIRMREPANIIAEMNDLKARYRVDRIRFVDDLFLSNRRKMETVLTAFVSDDVGMRWDATGRINVLDRAPTRLIDLMVASGCREVALGIETGSDRLLAHIDKKITVAQITSIVPRLCNAGINVKGYFILGLPTETREEHYATIRLIETLWEMTATLAGRFRCSVFEYRPYPGTPDWLRLTKDGYTEEQLLEYEAPAPDESHTAIAPPDRDEFNFSTGLQFGAVPVPEVRRNLAAIMQRQGVQ